MHTHPPLPFLTAALLCLIAGMWAPPPARAYVVTVQAENDILFGTDRNYTNGVRLAVAWETTDNDPDFAYRILDMISDLPKQAKRRWSTLSFGQSMFTPKDISQVPPDPNDRPYAGWLYVGIGHVMERNDAVDVIELQMGMVGPHSYAGDTQVWWHDTFGFDEPKGWDYQIGDEPAVALYYQHLWRGYRLLRDGGFKADITPHAGVAVGNLLTQVSAGATVRIGTHLSGDFGAPPRIQPSLPGSDYFSPSPNPHFYLFAGIEQRAVLRNIFLDGNTFRDSASVDKHHFVTEGHFGAVVLWGAMRVALTHVIRSNEFKTQTGGNAFSGVTISTAF